MGIASSAQTVHGRKPSMVSTLADQNRNLQVDPVSRENSFSVNAELALYPSFR